MESRRLRKESALSPHPERRRTWHRSRLLGFCLLAALFLYFVRAPLLRAAARFLDVSESPQAVDCVLVLGGGSQTRPFVAAALVKAGLTKEVLVPTIGLSAEEEAGWRLPEHDLIRGALIARGVPAPQIVQLDGHVSSTYEEALALARYLDQHPQRSVAVLTNSYHTRRARWIFQRVVAQRAAALHFLSAPSDGYDETNWWQSEAGFVTYLDEYLKFGFYLVSH
jgi:uncharacterized SAM-binding protein YcdF (DUF218 family)